MKTMNVCKRLGLALSALFLTGSLHATDLIVAPGGAGGSYASIKTAITAANNGDRIIVYPNPAGSSYSEGTITITKSLQILSANEGAFYAVDGTIVFTPATAGSSLSIMNMKLFTGGIASSAASPAGTRSVVNIINDSLMSTTGVGITHSNFNVTVANCYSNGVINIAFGRVIGNRINTTSDNCVYVVNDPSTNNTSDTLMIIGNKMNCYSASNTAAIAWANTSQYFQIMNNFIVNSYPVSNSNYGILINGSKASAAGNNTITNNSLLKTYYASNYYYYSAIQISANAAATVDVMNNLILGNSYSYTLYCVSGIFSTHYNYVYSGSWAGFTNDGTNVVATNVVYDSEGKLTNLACNAINGGNPDSAYVDINLTRNDAGAYGGSFTLDNFFPQSANDWARVFFVQAPRRVMVNGTINVRADGYDK